MRVLVISIKAVKLYEKVVEQDPKSQLAANNLAMLYADRFDDKDRLKKAQELIKVLKDTETPGISGYYWLGSL